MKYEDGSLAELSTRYLEVPFSVNMVLHTARGNADAAHRSPKTNAYMAGFVGIPSSSDTRSRSGLNFVGS